MYAYCSLSHIALPAIEEFAKGANALVPESVANGAVNSILSQRVDGKSPICDIHAAPTLLIAVTFFVSSRQPGLKIPETVQEVCKQSGSRKGKNTTQGAWTFSRERCSSLWSL